MYMLQLCKSEMLVELSLISVPSVRSERYLFIIQSDTLKMSLNNDCIVAAKSTDYLCFCFLFLGWGVGACYMRWRNAVFIDCLGGHQLIDYSAT